MKQVILAAIALTACGTSPLVKDHGDHAEVAVDEDCQNTSEIDSRLAPYLDAYKAAYAKSGATDLPIERLDKLVKFVIIPESEMLAKAAADGVEIAEGKTLLAYQYKVRCAIGIDTFVYKIFIPEPSTIGNEEAKAKMANAEIFQTVVFHEISHLFYDHVDGNKALGTVRDGLMAAKINDNPETIADGISMARLMQVFTDAAYKARLPKFFVPKAASAPVEPQADQSDSQGQD